MNKANNDSPPPKKKLIGGNLVENLRYGENPHQGASVYSLYKEILTKWIEFLGLEVVFPENREFATALGALEG